jgi:hypothetical protein
VETSDINDTIHTALMGIGEDGDDVIPLAEGLSLVRPTASLLANRWHYVQGTGEMEDEEKASRYLVCEYPQWLPDEGMGVARERGNDIFYAGLMAIQLIKPVRTLGFVYRHQSIERRPEILLGEWARRNEFDNAMLGQVPAMIARTLPAMQNKEDVSLRNALTFLQLGLEHFHTYVSGLLWVTGMEAIFDSGGREEFKKKLCDCLGPTTLAFPNWHAKADAPTYTVEEIAIPLFMLRNKIAHGADLRSAMNDKKHPVDLTKHVKFTSWSEEVRYSELLSEAACYLLCQVLQKVL